MWLANRKLKWLLAVVLLLPIWSTPVAAQALLQVELAGGKTVQLDREELDRLPRETIRTSTLWTDGEIEFQGVSLQALLDHLDITEGALTFVALNDYAVEIPLADAVPGGAIIADRMNGAPMSVREKGPLWVVYPFDSNPVYQAEMYYSRSIWQLHRIEVEAAQ